MQPSFLNKENIEGITIPRSDDTPISATEKLVRQDIEKLSRNAEEIKKLREQVNKEGGGSQDSTN